MSDHQSNPDQSTSLHLNKFAPGKPAAPASDETGVTISVKRAAEEIVQQSGQPVMPKDAGALPAREMLGAVSYCYAKGVYSSEGIERKMLKDPALREAVKGEMPDARTIRRFRRLNRDVIRATLEKAFRFLRRQEKADIHVPLPGQPASTPSTIIDGESTVTFAQKQAQETLDKAAFIDNMSKE